MQEVNKTFSNVGTDLLAIRRLKLDYLSVSIILFRLFFSCSVF